MACADPSDLLIRFSPMNRCYVVQIGEVNCLQTSIEVKTYYGKVSIWIHQRHPGCEHGKERYPLFSLMLNTYDWASMHQSLVSIEEAAYTAARDGEKEKKLVHRFGDSFVVSVCASNNDKEPFIVPEKIHYRHIYPNEADYDPLSYTKRIDHIDELKLPLSIFHKMMTYKNYPDICACIVDMYAYV